MPPANSPGQQSASRVRIRPVARLDTFPQTISAARPGSDITISPPYFETDIDEDAVVEANVAFLQRDPVEELSAEALSRELRHDRRRRIAQQRAQRNSSEERMTPRLQEVRTDFTRPPGQSHEQWAEQMRNRAWLPYLYRGAADQSAESRNSVGDGHDRSTWQPSQFRWAPLYQSGSDTTANHVYHEDDTTPLARVVDELRREQPATHEEVLLELARARLAEEQRARAARRLRAQSSGSDVIYRGHNSISPIRPTQASTSLAVTPTLNRASSYGVPSPHHEPQSLRSAAILQSVRRNQRLSARSRELMSRFVDYREQRTAALQRQVGGEQQAGDHPGFPTSSPRSFLPHMQLGNEEEDGSSGSSGSSNSSGSSTSGHATVRDLGIDEMNLRDAVEQRDPAETRADGGGSAPASTSVDRSSSSSIAGQLYSGDHSTSTLDSVGASNSNSGSTNSTINSNSNSNISRYERNRLMWQATQRPSWMQWAVPPQQQQQLLRTQSTSQSRQAQHSNNRPRPQRLGGSLSRQSSSGSGGSEVTAGATSAGQQFGVAGSTASLTARDLTTAAVTGSQTSQGTGDQRTTQPSVPATNVRQVSEPLEALRRLRYLEDPTLKHDAFAHLLYGHAPLSHFERIIKYLHLLRAPDHEFDKLMHQLGFLDYINQPLEFANLHANANAVVADNKNITRSHLPDTNFSSGRRSPPSLSPPADQSTAKRLQLLADRHFILNMAAVCPPAPTSWLSPGTLFSGFQQAAPIVSSSQTLYRLANGQTFNSSTPRRMSRNAYRRPSRASHTATRPAWLNNEHLASMSQSQQAAASPSPAVSTDRWTVKVSVHSVDYDTMTLQGTMEAHNVPSITTPTPPGSSASSGAAEAEPATSNTTFSTYLEGELIDFTTHTLLTTPEFNVKTTPDIDAAYWRKLEPFSRMSDDEIARVLLDRQWIEEELMQKYVLMRWKERCFVRPTFTASSTSSSCSSSPSTSAAPSASPSTENLAAAAAAASAASSRPARPSSPERLSALLEGQNRARAAHPQPPRDATTSFLSGSDGNGYGLSISGFYYVSLRRKDGRCEGLYFDPQSSPYQHLELSPSEGMWGSGVWEFR